VSAPTLYPYFVERSELLGKAYELAVEAHTDMVRKGGGEPFINHPVRVSAAVERCGLSDEAVAAALCHDVVEDTTYTLDDIRAALGDAVAGLVDALTEDKAIGEYEQRKHHHLAKVKAAGGEAAAIFCADKLVNLQDMLRAYEVEGERLVERFNAPLDQKDVHTAQHISMLSDIDAVVRLPVFAQLNATFAEYLALRQTSRA
jgi:(p)ppGpp synthase/HD superfamily hydrolase